MNKNDKHYLHLVGVFYELYNVPFSDKYESILKDMCCNDYYMIIGMEDQYVGNWHNNSTHISSVAMHVGMVDIHKLLPWPCQMLLHTYNSHLVSNIFYKSLIDNYPFN